MNQQGVNICNAFFYLFIFLIKHHWHL